MKRDWDIIRDILVAVEEDRYESYFKETANNDEKLAILNNAVLLIDAGFINGKPLNMRGGVAFVTITGLTWSGHDLLDTIRSKPVWEKIKSTAFEKGIELSFDAVKALGVKALEFIIGT